MTNTAGTGLVHTAPAHGQDDFRIGWSGVFNKKKIFIVCTLQDYSSVLKETA